MNDQSRLSSAPDSQVVDAQTILHRYQRIFNIAYGDHVYANIEPCMDMSVQGVVMQVTTQGFENLKERECHYDCVDVSSALEGDWSVPVYAFVGQDNTVGHETIKQSYIDLCLSGVARQEQEKWLDETIMNFPIHKTT